MNFPSFRECFYVGFASRKDSAKAWTGRLLACGFIALAAGSVSFTSQGNPPPARFMLAAQDAATIPDGAFVPAGSGKIVMPLRQDPTTRIVGQVVWYNLKELSYLDREKVQHQIEWEQLDPERLPRFINLLPDKRDAASLLLTSELLINHGGDERMVERMLDLALKVDKSTQGQIDALREKMKNGDGSDKPEEKDSPKAGDGEGKEAGDDYPTNANSRAWPKLSEEQHAAAVQKLKDSTDKVLKKMNHKMGRTETERFLVYSDMPKKESEYWTGVLDKMYDKLCETFDLDKEVNIWKGKCLLLFFNNRNDFLKYNVAAYGNNPTGAAGICYQFGTGDVHISMWKQSPKLELAHTLVHEAAHGFLFRYQSSHYVPNWLNEGLAEYISVALVDPPGYPRRATSARQFVKQRNSLDNFLSAQNIIGPHYGLAFDVTDLMVAENRKGYVKMIQGIKSGKTAAQAFEEDYGASIDKVLQYYARKRLKIDNLKVDVP